MLGFSWFIYNCTVAVYACPAVPDVVSTKMIVYHLYINLYCEYNLSQCFMYTLKKGNYSTGNLYILQSINSVTNMFLCIYLQMDK